MVRSTHFHYTCDQCKKEIIYKNKSDIYGWIVIRSDEITPLLVTYMRDGWDDEDSDLYGEQSIYDELNFCCADCMVKHLLKHVGESLSDKPYVTKNTREPAPKKTRFDVMGQQL